MNEVREIVEAFDAAGTRGERCALATVVSVEGSSYRSPGAKLLFCEGGTSAGTISAGCLETDVIEHAKNVIKTNQAKLVEYNTGSTSDELVWGLGLGCNGIVRVLIEPLAPQSSYIDALRQSFTLHGDAGPIVVATLFQNSPANSIAAEVQAKIGTRFMIYGDGEVSGDMSGNEHGPAIVADMRSAVDDDGTAVRVYEGNGGTTKVFFETLTPPVQLMLFGAGHDALPIVELARGLGWQTEVVDPQARQASCSRFAQADTVTLARPENANKQVRITKRTLALLMTHNYSHDLELLKFLLTSPARYIGVMGPRKRTERMLSELAENDSNHPESDLSRLYSPAGLDLGANTPGEIALSIVAEMSAVLNARHGGMLRERNGSIHRRVNDNEPGPVLLDVSKRPVPAA